MNRTLARCAATLMLAATPALADIADSELLGQLRASAPDCGRFEQSRWLADFEMHLNSSGEFRRLPEGLLWRTTQPVLSEVALTADNPDLPLGYQAILPVFNGLLAGNLDSLDAYFNTRVSGSPDQWRAELSPLNEQLATQLTGLVIQGAQQLEQISVSFGDGDRLQIRLFASACAAADEMP